MTAIKPVLIINLSLSGGDLLTDGSTQFFTQATGQRAYTLSDTIGSLSDQVNANTDATSDPDAPDTIYRFGFSTSDTVLKDKVKEILKYDSLSTWNDVRTSPATMTYVNSTWQ